MTDLESLSTKIAALLLVQRGEITLADIQALPFVDSPERAAAIAARLAAAFPVHTYQRKRSASDATSWDEVIRLEEAPAHAQD